ncbi:MAG: DNA repair protein RecO (recombination protein O) [Candidatus Paceibacteria bacterium]|jgi:DNA repair protein RecO (recombination protein O)
MHNIYNTDAFVMNNIPSNEADYLIILFSKEFGLIKAKAKGVRYLKSKLRFSLQPYCFSKVSLVKGKGGWMIVNASPEENMKSGLSYKNFMVVARVSALLERLLQGEEKNEGLYEILTSSKKFLEGEIKDENILDIEYMLALRILDNLGYISSRAELREFLDDHFRWDNDLLDKMNQKSKFAINEINRAIKESQL